MRGGENDTERQKKIPLSSWQHCTSRYKPMLYILVYRQADENRDLNVLASLSEMAPKSTATKREMHFLVALRQIISSSDI